MGARRSRRRCRDRDHDTRSDSPHDTRPDPRSPAASRWQAALARRRPRPARIAGHAGPAMRWPARLSDAAAAQFPLRVPRGFVARMRRGDPHDPLLRQVLPSWRRGPRGRRLQPGCGRRRRRTRRRRRPDPQVRGPCPAGRHRQLRGALPLLLPPALPVCARKPPRATGWREAVADYLRADPTIDEVILSGGDPLSLATHKLAELTDALRAPARTSAACASTPACRWCCRSGWTPTLLAWLRGLPWPVAVVIHANHANEFDADVDAALAAPARRRATAAQPGGAAARGQRFGVEAWPTCRERAVRPPACCPTTCTSSTGWPAPPISKCPMPRPWPCMRDLAARLPGYLVPRLVREVAGAPAARPRVRDCRTASSRSAY